MNVVVPDADVAAKDFPKLVVFDLDYTLYAACLLSH